MKRLSIILGIVAFLLIVLIVTKPSKERCRNDYKEKLIIMTSTDFVLFSDKDLQFKNSALQKRMELEMEVASEKFSREHWEDYYGYNDYLIFCTIKFKGNILKKKIGLGILNSTFEYK